MTYDRWVNKTQTEELGAWRKVCFCEDSGWCPNRFNLYEVVMRCLLVALRCTVPWLVFQFDTYIWFNLCSGIFSSLLAMRRKIGVIAHWKHLVKRYPEAVHHFNVKLLGTNNGDSLAAAAASASSGKADWSVEARSAEWQCWARAWNEIISSLRFTDVLSNVERDELVPSQATPSLPSVPSPLSTPRSTQL